MRGIYDYTGNPIRIVAYSSPDDYNATGDGVSDDTIAIQNALNERGYVVFTPTKTYKVTQTLRIYADTVVDLNGATILSTNKHLMYNFLSSDVFTGYSGNGNIVIKNGTIVGGAISLAHGQKITLENIRFENSLNDHFLEIAGCKDYSIRGCSFKGMENLSTSVLEYINIDPCIYRNLPWLPEGSAFYDGTINDGLEITGCSFEIGADSYAYGYNAIGVHSTGGTSVKHKNIVIANNVIKGFTGCGIRLNHMQGVYVSDNSIVVSGDGIVVGDVAACSEIVIKDNYINPTSAGTPILLTSGMYSDLTVANNVSHGQNDMN